MKQTTKDLHEGAKSELICTILVALAYFAGLAGLIYLNTIW